MLIFLRKIKTFTRHVGVLCLCRLLLSTNDVLWENLIFVSSINIVLQYDMVMHTFRASFQGSSNGKKSKN